MRWKISIGVTRLFIYLMLILGGIVFAIPFVWLVSTSLKVDTQIFASPPQWIPRPIRWSNYVDVFRTVPYLSWLKNTLYVTCMSLIGNTIVSSIVGYSFARLEWKGRDLCFALMLSTMMLPPQVTMVPLYLIYRNLGWINSFRPLYLPFYFGIPFHIFLMRQFMLTIPVELEEAAYVDGCSPYGIYWRIILPLVKPALTTVAIFTFMNVWNDFLNPLVYISDPDLMTLSLGLRYFQAEYETNWALLMAASSMMVLPVIVIFFSAQKYFIEGIAFSGLKG